MTIGIGVSVNPFAKGVNEYRPFSVVNRIGGTAHCLHRVKRISTIAVDNSQISKSAKILGHYRVGGLLCDRNRDPVAVVLHDEYHRQAFTAGSIQRFEHLSFRPGRFPPPPSSARVGALTFASS